MAFTGLGNWQHGPYKKDVRNTLTKKKEHMLPPDLVDHIKLVNYMGQTRRSNSSTLT